ncbi:MAG: PKD domain-containing protein, partial [Bacteroidetes bacterium]|nr:PKD domain-containing protein [Bacteroidota bacterium]
YAVDATGCQSLPVSVTVTVSPPISVTAANATGCEGQPVTISANAAGGNNGPYTYTWSNGYIGQSQPVTVLLSSSPATYIVTVSDGCSNLAFDTVIVTVNPLAIGNMILSDTSGCEPFTLQFTGTSDIGTNYTWIFGDSTSTATGATVIHTYNTAGSYTVTLIISTATGCQTTITNSQTIDVYASPIADFSVSPSVNPIPNATTVDFTNLSTGATSYLWDFGDGNTSAATNPQHYYPLTGNYLMTLIATNGLGCTDTFSMKTVSESYIHFANAFTPNPNGGNGGTYNFIDLNNDVFFPTSAGVQEYHLMIYNKWGELLFESFDINKGWDGYYKGKICAQDVYVWKAFAKFIDGTKFSDAGDVTLLR